MKLISALKVVVSIAMLLVGESSACVAIGDPCSKTGTACCSSSDSAQNSQCIGDSNMVFLRSYTCTECANDSPRECYDTMTEPEWYFTIFATAVFIMMAFIFVFGVIMEMLKCFGVIPNPVRPRPNHDGHDHDEATKKDTAAVTEDDTSKALLVLIL